MECYISVSQLINQLINVNQNLVLAANIMLYYTRLFEEIETENIQLDVASVDDTDSVMYQKLY